MSNRKDSKHKSRRAMPRSLPARVSDVTQDSAETTDSTFEHEPPRSRWSPTTFRRWLVVAVLVPVLVVFTANLLLVWNHFVEGPYLHDSGWFSALVYHAGIFPKNPPVANSAPDFYGMHVSPVISLGSMLSYLVPMSRIPYFCFFQGLLVIPLGAAVGILVGKDGYRPKWSDAAVVALISLVFSLNGQVLSCVAYPHFEVLLSAGLCILLVGLARGQARVAWVGMALAVLAREDGGLHCAAFLAAVLMSHWMRRPFPIAPRKVAVMGGAALALSILALIFQKIFFHPAHLFEEEYLGSPMWSHINADVLEFRFHRLFTEAGVVTYPMLATAVIAIAKRDARYLLGWLVEMPWFVLNFLARQDLKSVFSIYTGFPFVASAFWVAAYGRVAAEEPRRRYWLSSVVVVASMATLGVYVSHPSSVVHDYKAMFRSPQFPGGELAAFAADIVRQPSKYGRFYFDPGMAAWALEGVSPQDRLWEVADVHTYDGYDGATFFANGLWRPHIDRFMKASPFQKCGRISNTYAYCCTRPERELPPQFKLAGKP